MLLVGGSIMGSCLFPVRRKRNECDHLVYIPVLSRHFRVFEGDEERSKRDLEF